MTLIDIIAVLFAITSTLLIIPVLYQYHKTDFHVNFDEEVKTWLYQKDILINENQDKNVWKNVINIQYVQNVHYVKKENYKKNYYNTENTNIQDTKNTTNFYEQ